MSHDCHIHCLKLVGLGGSNKVMAGELSRLARRAFTGERSRELLERPPQKVGPGGLVYPFAPDLAALAVTYHRTSARVLWGLYKSSQARLEPLFAELREAVAHDDRAWMQDKMTFSVLAFHPDSVAAGERQVVGVVKNALIEGAAERGLALRLDVERPDVTFLVRGERDQEGKELLTVSIDLAGRPMHQRGYRTRAGEAPLREDLAANLVMLGRFDGRSEVFVDPLAGSGTLAIEAALMAAGKQVWMSGRSPAGRSLKPLEPSFQDLGKPLFGDCVPRIYAAEVDEETYGALDRSLATAGTSPQTTTFLGDFRDWDLASQLGPDTKGLILTNPPYGSRLATPERQLRELYRDLGEWCREFRGFRAGFIIGEPHSSDGPRPGDEARSEGEASYGPSVGQMFQDAFGGKPRVKKPLANGPLRAQFLLYDL